MPGKTRKDALFALRMLMAKYREKQKEFRFVFINLEKVYDTVPKKELGYCLRKAGVTKEVRE